MKTRWFRDFLLLALLGAPFAHGNGIEIDAGDLPRDQSIVVIPRNPNDGSGIAANAPLRSAGTFQTQDGSILHYQRDAQGTVTFLSPRMERGQTLLLRPTPIGGSISPKAFAKETGDQVQLWTEKIIASYQTTSRVAPRDNLDPKFLRGGYLHPIFSPSGKIVTDDYALNHLHHHGVWTAWTKTSFDGREPDFWNMGQGKGKVDFVSLEKSWSGPVEAGFISKLKQTDLTSGSPIDVLNETWTVRTYAVGNDFNIIDLESVQTCATDKPLLLPIYHYGGIGIRGREEWNGRDNASFVTSENLTDRNKANSQPARWIAMNGKVGDGIAGIAILSHPENFRAPQPVRTHPTEPFISIAPQSNESMSIQPGETYRMKYRFITFDGEPDAAKLEALWQDYAHPVRAVWKD